MGERTFGRWSRRYEEEGEAGLLDRRIGKVSGKRVPVDRFEAMEALYRTRYQDFTARHFMSTWCGIIGSAGAAAVPRRSCKAATCWRRRGANRRKRPRLHCPA
jgi:hypothetical protein